MVGRTLVLASMLSMLPATAVAKTDTLTVVTLNLWNDQHGWPERLNVIVAELRRIRPDVVCLQEVLQNPSLRNQAETLGDSLGCHVQFASVDGPERPKRYGNAILTPHPVKVGESRNLAPANDYRAAAHVRFEWRGRTVDAYSTHLHHTPEGGSIRATQIRHLLAYIDSTRGGGPVVLAGDFNCELGSPELDLVTTRYADVFQALHPHASRAEAVTYNSRFGPDPGVIDHIFVDREGSKRLRPLASNILFRTVGPDSVWASDRHRIDRRVSRWHHTPPYGNHHPHSRRLAARSPARTPAPRPGRRSRGGTRAGAESDQGQLLLAFHGSS